MSYSGPENLKVLQERHSIDNVDVLMKNNIPTGDVVFLKDENESRVMWRKSKITKLIKRKDDIIRGVNN